MNITIHGELKYIPVSTVTLYSEGEGTTYPFHCVTCGNTTNIIGGKVVKIYPILEPSSQITVVTTCKSCKAKYVFHDTQQKPDDSISVLLFPKVTSQSFYCYLGGGEVKSVNRILDYDREKNYSYGENSMVTIPYTTHCTNHDCDLVYKFKQLS